MINLDILAGEFKAAGIPLRHYSDDLLAAGGWSFWKESGIDIWGQPGKEPYFWEVTDIVRKHMKDRANDK